MKIIDVFPKYYYFNNEAFCLYCKESLNHLKHLSNPNMLEYFCSSCNESFAVQFDGNARYFIFTIFEKEIIIDLREEKISINNKNLIWFPYFKMNFSNKNKLNVKLKNLIMFL